MNARIFRLVTAGWLSVGALALTTAAKPDNDGANADKQAAAEAKPTLKKGMSADEVIRLIGRPVEVKPMKTKVGKAEEWIYRRQVGTNIVQVPSGERDVPMFTGSGVGNDAQQMRHEVIYTQQQVKVYQVTTLLMFDGKLVLANQKLEQDNRFD